jgi:hypothetical protein
VRWYEIQQLFHNVKFDVLLLLDCCYAGLAGRGLEYLPPGPVELLAASGDTETPGPGDGSFTAIMIEVMKKHLEKYKQIRISKLHTDLLHRKSDLYTLPFHVNLRESPSERSILLECLESPNEQGIVLPHWKAAVDLTIRLDHAATKSRLDALIRWLRMEAARAGVSEIRVNNVLQTTGDLSKFIEDTMLEKQNPIVKTIDKSRLDQIGHAWSAFQQLVAQFDPHEVDGTEDEGDDGATTITSRVLELLDDSNSRLLRIIQKAVLMSHLSSDPIAIEEAIEDPASDLLQLRSQLVLRRIICGTDVELAEEPSPHPNNILEEYKSYGEQQSPSQIKATAARLELLASILKAEKPEEFRCLRLYKWQHRQFERRFAYQFSVPNIYQKNPVSLHEAIISLRRHLRPTLEERLAMAYRIAKAVEHWHGVDWVHQGISSHNILFFKLQSQERWEFTAPMLQGFDFSRPNAKPSLEPYVQNIEFDVYRHPDRQGPSCDGHKKIHDLYSLGIVLLEIGLWSTALDTVEARIKAQSAGSSRQRMRDITKQDIPTDYMFKSLQEAARHKLAHTVGTQYQEAVLTCLTSDFGVLEDDRKEKRLLDAMEKLVLWKLAKNYTR